MDFSWRSILEICLLVAALSVDAFVASFAYGSNRIKIPFLSVLITSGVCTGVLAVSLLLGTVLRGVIPQSVTVAVCFCILLILGLIRLLDSTIKSFIKKHSQWKKHIKFSLFNLHFILQLYAEPEKADVDQSRILSPGEAATLAVALSLDGLAAGFGAGAGGDAIVPVILLSLLFNALAVMGGGAVGRKVAEKIPLNLSWLSGVLLIGLAFLKL